MAIEVNPGHAGLDTLAGQSMNLIEGLELPGLLYVYGLQDRREADVWLDEGIPNAETVAGFIRTKIGVSARVGLPGEPRRRPAIGIVRRLRAEDSLPLATKIAVFVLLHVNGKIGEFPELPPVRPALLQNWTPRRGDKVLVGGNQEEGYIMEIGRDNNFYVNVQGAIYHDVLENIRPAALRIGSIVRVRTPRGWSSGVITDIVRNNAEIRDVDNNPFTYIIPDYRYVVPTTP